ncbi:cyclase family protein [Fulvivirga sp. 29W222]|uniref:Cyclase family protein n=1 Tax=Fulvivirga marina TaxID=2494733 RepID=A0A937KH91_9BACT|nr:cyclase family protein [Fulvivirga marina]MBL6449943.1 cyclase family protein [Fulvivirga marina]
MKASFILNGIAYEADLTNPLDISIPLKEGDNNPNCYYAEPVKFKTIKSGNFIGSVALGGSVNYQSISITPHGNGTHTECYGHISSDKEATLNTCLTRFHFITQVMTLSPTNQLNGDKIIRFEDFRTKFHDGVEAVVIRTTPNTEEKLHQRYSGTNPCYIGREIAEFLREKKVKHLLVDLPSVDKEVDGGELKSHRAFWNMDGNIRKDCTITELIYVNNDVKDGLYLLNLQVTSLEVDASPSKPVLFKVSEN